MLRNMGKSLMYNRILPDFKEIASHVVDKSELSELLEEIYNKGYYAGRLDEENEWYAAQDKEAVDAEKG